MDHLLSVIVILLLSSLIGLTIVKTIDAHLQNISINMPTIKLPEQKFLVNVNKLAARSESEAEAEPKPESEPPVITISKAGEVPASKIPVSTFNTLASQRGGSANGSASASASASANANSSSNGMICKKDLPPARDHYNSDKYRSESKPITKMSIIVPEPTKDHVERATPLEVKPSMGVPPLSNNRDTYYKDPAQMTNAQLIKFQEKAKFHNMTVKDYENWLMTFANTPEKLIGFHRANLKVLVRGGSLSKVDLPQSTRTPSNAKDQYTRIMQDQIDHNIPQPEFAGYQPSNYEEQIGHKVQKNRNLRHLDYVNSDEPLKTWSLQHAPHKLEMEHPRPVLKA